MAGVQELLATLEEKLELLDQVPAVSPISRRSRPRSGPAPDRVRGWGIRRSPRRRCRALIAVAATAPAAGAAEEVRELSFRASDGVTLHATVAGQAPLTRRPLVVEFSPYGQGPGSHPPLGPGFNYVYVHARGTGRSGGAWDIMGAREQQDIAESLRYFCDRPFSSGRIGLYGFSASAIAAYHAMRRGSLPCVRAASMLAGTSSLYRDLIFIGGMPNLVPATVVTGAIAGSFLANLPGRAGDPASALSAPGGVTNAIDAFLGHPTEDGFWGPRRFPGPGGPPADIPILAATGFYDVESRGPVRGVQVDPPPRRPAAGHRRARRGGRRHGRREPALRALVRAPSARRP